MRISMQYFRPKVYDFGPIIYNRYALNSVHAPWPPPPTPSMRSNLCLLKRQSSLRKLSPLTLSSSSILSSFVAHLSKKGVYRVSLIVSIKRETLMSHRPRVVEDARCREIELRLGEGAWFALAATNMRDAAAAAMSRARAGFTAEKIQFMEYAKVLGARWDPERKKWYAPAGCDLAPLGRDIVGYWCHA